MNDEQVRAQTVRELTQIRAFLEEQTGLSSRWNGSVELITESRLQGQKPFDCSIRINVQLAEQPVRWRTLLHESLHALSAGYTRDSYRTLTGWEEGVVESNQRLYRPALLRWLNVVVEDSVFSFQEERHAFNRYIDALEELRNASAYPPDVFYRDLLQTPLPDRPGYVLGMGRALFGVRYATDFLPLFARANAVLKSSAPQAGG